MNLERHSSDVNRSGETRAAKPNGEVPSALAIGRCSGRPPEERTEEEPADGRKGEPSSEPIGEYVGQLNKQPHAEAPAESRSTDQTSAKPGGQAATGRTPSAKPAVSVLIPTYNRPGPLCELLETLARQTFRDFEAIIVNDGGEPVDFVRDLYPELALRVLQLPDNAQHVHARNQGLAAARADLVLLCDDDDLLLPDHLRRMMASLEGRAGEGPADLVYSDAEIFDSRTEGRTRIPVRRYPFAYRMDLAGMRRFSTFIPSGALYRKRVHDEIGLFDPEVFHYWDWDFFLRVSDRFKVKKVPAATVLYSFAGFGSNLSAVPEEMRPYLNRLCVKHGLGQLPVANFYTLLQEPEVARRREETEILWDFAPVVSRWAACGCG